MKSAPVAVLALAFVSGLAAQQPDPPGQLSVQQPSVRSVQYQALREEAYSDSHDSKMSALDALERKMTGDASASPPPEAESILEYLALEGTGHRVRQAGKLMNYFPDVRRRAVALLARINADQAAYTLTNVLLGDNEPMVTAEAAYSLGSLTLPDNVQIVNALTWAVIRQDHSRPDNNWAFAILTAFDRQSQRPGGIRSSAAYQAIVTIATSGYSRTVRDKAFQVLGKLTG